MEESYESVNKPSGVTGSYENEQNIMQQAVYQSVVILGGGMLKIYTLAA